VFSGCSAIILNNKNAIDKLKKNFSNICLDSEGKGRIKFLSTRYSFQYETLLEKEKFLWTLGLEIPMAGQKTMAINYKNVLLNKIDVSGNFYFQLKREIGAMKNGRIYDGLLMKFLRIYALFLKLNDSVESEIRESNCLLDNTKTNSSRGICNVFDKKRKFSWELLANGVDFEYLIDDDYVAWMQFRELNGKCYSRSKFFLRDIKNGGPDRDIIALELFQ